jgi:hypothetical protein
VPEARGRAVILFNEEVGHFHQLPADFKDWKAHMSITATAVVKKETKVDPKKPQDKVIELPEDEPTYVHFAQCARCGTEFTFVPDSDWVTVVYPGMRT